MIVEDRPNFCAEEVRRRVWLLRRSSKALKFIFFRFRLRHISFGLSLVTIFVGLDVAGETYQLS